VQKPQAPFYRQSCSRAWRLVAACSMKWKVAAQNSFCATLEPAERAWQSGRKVRKAIGFDSGAQDRMRYAEAAANAQDDKRYEYIYPFRDWRWDRERCIQEILATGLPVPVKRASAAQAQNPQNCTNSSRGNSEPLW